MPKLPFSPTDAFNRLESLRSSATHKVVVQRGLIIIVAFCALLACHPRGADQPIGLGDEAKAPETPAVPEPVLVPSYEEFIERVHSSPKTSAALFTYLDKDMPAYWDDTTWDFYGMSRIPGEGEIACGYFVTTCSRT